MRTGLIGLLYIIVFASGYVLTQTAKPYGALLLTLHKLIALGAVVLAVVRLVQASRIAPLEATTIIATVFTGIAIVALFATGAILSLEKPAASAVRLIHHVSPYVALLGTAAVLWFAQGGW